MTSAADASSIRDLKDAARRYLPRIIFDYIEGGAEDELGIDRNRAAFEAIELMPRYLVDVSRVNQATTLLGTRYTAPFGIAPTGMAAITRHDADGLLAKAAHDAGIPFILSGAGNASTERIAKAAPTAWYQLYIPKKRELREDLVRRAADAGIGTLVVTIDVPIYSKRERDVRNGWVRPYNPKWPAKLEALRHPAWLMAYLRRGIPHLENWQAYAPPGTAPVDVATYYGEQSFAVQTWDVLAEIRAQWPGKLVLKGVLSPDDAALACDAGVDGIVVSNHGGRQLDKAPAAIAALPAVLQAVAGRVPVMVDSGIMRGSDVVAALALGASFAFVGRATLYAVAAYGLPGVERAIALLKTEIELALKSIGCPDAADLNPRYIHSAPGLHR